MAELDQLPEADLIEKVRTYFEAVDPVPEVVLSSAKACLTWRSVDAELAELTEDTALEPAVGVRGPHPPRLLTFTAATTTVVVEVADIGARRRLVGQLGDPRSAAVEVRTPHGTTAVDADELGRFVLDGVPAGPVSLICRFAGGDGAPIVTDWVTV